MPSVVFYFQIHQPFRLRKYTVFDSDPQYFDNQMNAQLVRRIADNCYRPMIKLLLEEIARHQGRFRFALSITGTALEQFEAYAPEVVQGLHALANTNCVEFLAETYYHSLASLHSHNEFNEQVELHRRIIKRLFNQTPTVFRNTELIYSNDVAALAANLAFRGLLAEGWDPVLNNRSAAFLYRSVLPRPSDSKATSANAPLLLLRNYRLSDAISFRFADPRSPDFPMTDEKFSLLVSQIGGRLCNLFMDFETFGEHQKANTGIFDFMRSIPAKLLAHNCDFQLPGHLIAAAENPPQTSQPGTPAGLLDVDAAGDLNVPHPISWADEARDLGAWMGNAMQTNALQELYALEPIVKHTGDPTLLADWRKLTTSDHFYYMSTKDNADGSIHAYFRPYDSPYDAYINFMNIIDNLRARAR